MNIGNLSIGRRMNNTNEFKLFYNPLGSWSKPYFVFFWWFGRNFYMCLRRKDNT